jgi:hypothetical protein
MSKDITNNKRKLTGIKISFTDTYFQKNFEHQPWYKQMEDHSSE